FDRSPTAETARRIRGHVPTAVEHARQAILESWRQRHVHDVVTELLNLSISTVFDRPQLVGTPDHALRQQKPGSQLPIRTRRCDDHGERLAVQPDFEWLLGGGPIDRVRRLAVLYSDNRHVPPWRRFWRRRSRAVVRTHVVHEALARVSVG